MNHIRWVGWGVVDVDGTMDRQQRRNFLRKIRKELDDIRCGFVIGGKKSQPHYAIHRNMPDGAVKKQAFAGDGALKKICAWILLETNDHVSSEDGGLRGAGAESSSDTNELV